MLSIYTYPLLGIFPSAHPPIFKHTIVMHYHQSLICLIFVLLIFCSCATDPYEIAVTPTNEFTYQQVTGTFYQINASIKAEDPNFDYTSAELETNRVDIAHCKLFRSISNDTIEIWDRSAYKDVIKDIREGLIYNIKYDKMINNSGFDRTLSVIGDKQKDPNFSVPQAFDNNSNAYRLQNSGDQIVVVEPTRVYTVQGSIVADYGVKYAGTNETVKIIETHQIVKVIENPILKVPKEQLYCQ